MVGALKASETRSLGLLAMSAMKGPTVRDINGTPITGGAPPETIMPCPYCGLEPQVKVYYRSEGGGIRRGYACECGGRIIDGVVAGVNID